jgi:murein DD-endopeptidase MepM/ murein hydrolase activator NlpD
MHLILLSKKRGSWTLQLPKLLFWVLFSISLGVVALIALGYSLGSNDTQQQQADSAILELRNMLQHAQATVEQVRTDQSIHLDALGLRIATLQARMMRLDAVGERMARLGGLDQNEFNFENVPPMGGNLTESGLSQSLADINTDLAQVSALLNDREGKLDVLEAQWSNQLLLQSAIPSGRPIQEGWISSRYGRRTDPINGRKNYHKGVDFAARTGTPIYSVASGVVKRAKTVVGFGNVVEIEHADGYSTLYAHNQKNLVNQGEIVHKGQLIALLGSTGRSSGPHVHFEIHKEGRPVNPKNYINR